MPYGPTPIPMAEWAAFWKATYNVASVEEWIAKAMPCPECGARVRDMTRTTEYEDLRYAMSDAPVSTALSKDDVRLVPCGHAVPWQVLHPRPEPTPIYDALIREQRKAREEAEAAAAWATVEPLLERPCTLSYLRYGNTIEEPFATLAEAIAYADMLIDGAEGIPQKIVVDVDDVLTVLPWAQVAPAVRRVASECDG